MDALKLGPFILKPSMLFALGAGFVVFIVIKRIKASFQKQLLDALLNCVLIFLIFYKGSILIFHPEFLTVNPFGALSLNGGVKEWSAGMGAAGIFLFYQYKKQKWEAAEFIKAIIYAAVTFITAFWLFRTLFFLAF